MLRARHCSHQRTLQPQMVPKCGALKGRSIPLIPYSHCLGKPSLRALLLWSVKPCSSHTGRRPRSGRLYIASSAPKHSNFQVLRQSMFPLTPMQSRRRAAAVAPDPYPYLRSRHTELVHAGYVLSPRRKASACRDPPPRWASSRCTHGAPLTPHPHATCWPPIYSLMPYCRPS